MNLNLETLEGRIVPATVKVIGANMYVQADWTDKKGISVFSISSSLIVVNNVSHQVPSKVTYLMVVGSEYGDNINLQSASKFCTVIGSAGNDSILGSHNNDNIDGGEGDDNIDGWMGSDTIVGGNGNDRLFGGGGFDSIVGGFGNDYIDGGTEADVIEAGAGNDTVFGQSGNDSVRGGDGDDYIDGGFGEDSLFGENGKDKIYGREGYDLLVGGLGHDYIDGRDGSSRVDLRDNIWLENYGQVFPTSYAINSFAADTADFVNGSKYKYW